MTTTNLVFLIFGGFLLIVSIVSFLIYKKMNKTYNYDILALILFSAIIISISFFSKYCDAALSSNIMNKAPESFYYNEFVEYPDRYYKFVDNYGNKSNELFDLYLEEGTSFNVVNFSNDYVFFKTTAVSEKGSYNIEVRDRMTMVGNRIDKTNKEGTIKLIDVFNYFFEFSYLVKNVNYNASINVTCYSKESVNKLNQGYTSSYVKIGDNYTKLDSLNFNNYNLICKIAVNSETYYLVKWEEWNYDRNNCFIYYNRSFTSCCL